MGVTSWEGQSRYSRSVHPTGECTSTWVTGSTSPVTGPSSQSPALSTSRTITTLSRAGGYLSSWSSPSDTAGRRTRPWASPSRRSWCWTGSRSIPRRRRMGRRQNYRRDSSRSWAREPSPSASTSPTSLPTRSSSARTRMKIPLTEQWECFTRYVSTWRKMQMTLGTRKAQYASADMKQRSPTSTAEKGFMFGSGKLVVEASLDREVFYHGEDLPIHISIINNSKKCVKNIRCHINQHAELSMVNAQYSCKVARLDTQDGCPLQPGGNINKTVVLKPLAQNCRGIRGLCLDASLSKVTDESNLASSSLAETGNVNDLLGVVVSYSVKIKLILSGMGGELETDLPFKLVHPCPNSEQ